MDNLIDYRKFGAFCIDQGKQFLNKATPVKKTVYSASQILTTLKNATNLDANRIYSADEKHFTTNIDTWKTIIENDWTNKKTWVEDYFDCDNFAGSFSSYCADIYGLNSAALITVELRNPETDKHIGYHRVCVIIDDKLQCWLLETQTDKMILIEPGKPLVIDTWRYYPNYITIN